MKKHLEKFATPEMSNSSESSSYSILNQVSSNSSNIASDLPKKSLAQRLSSNLKNFSDVKLNLAETPNFAIPTYNYNELISETFKKAKKVQDTPSAISNQGHIDNFSDCISIMTPIKHKELGEIEESLEAT